MIKWNIPILYIYKIRYFCYVMLVVLSFDVIERVVNIMVQQYESCNRTENIRKIRCNLIEFSSYTVYISVCRFNI